MKPRKPRKRNHSLYISFTVHKGDDPAHMCIARLPERFVTVKEWRKLLTTVAKFYNKASIYDIWGMDGLCDPPGFDPDLSPFYEESNKQLFPKLESAFRTGGYTGFETFNLWAYNGETMELVRSAKGESLNG